MKHLPEKLEQLDKPDKTIEENNTIIRENSESETDCVNDADETLKNHKNTEQMTFKCEKSQSVYSYFPYLNEHMWVFLFVTYEEFATCFLGLWNNCNTFYSSLYILGANPLANSDKEISPIMMSIIYGAF